MSAAQTGLWVKKSLQIQFHKYKSTFKPYYKKRVWFNHTTFAASKHILLLWFWKAASPSYNDAVSLLQYQGGEQRFYMVQKMDFLGMGRTYNQPTICYTVYLRLALMIHNSPYELQQSFSYSE